MSFWVKSKRPAQLVDKEEELSIAISRRSTKNFWNAGAKVHFITYSQGAKREKVEAY